MQAAKHVTNSQLTKQKHQYKQKARTLKRAMVIARADRPSLRKVHTPAQSGHSRKRLPEVGP